MVMLPDTNNKSRMLPFGDATLHSWYSVRTILRLIIEREIHIGDQRQHKKHFKWPKKNLTIH